jgi:LacI family transcriptional regulator
MSKCIYYGRTIEVKYKPNFNAVGLVNSRTHNIGVVLPFITNYYFSTVITGIEEVAWSRGYNIILYVTNDSPEKELSILENLSYSSVDGLLVCRSSHSDSCEYFQKIIDSGVPVSCFLTAFLRLSKRQK